MPSTRLCPLLLRQGRRSTPYATARPRGRQPIEDPVAEQFPLHLGERGDDGQHECASRCRRIDAELQDAEMNAPIPELVDELEEVTR